MQIASLFSARVCIAVADLEVPLPFLICDQNFNVAPKEPELLGFYMCAPFQKYWIRHCIINITKSNSREY
jgi:hypothetical protein